MKTAEDAKKARQEAVDQILKKYGAEAISGASELHYDVISTGAAAIDKASGIGGLPRGRIVSIAGPPSSGKSTLCMHIVAEAQAAGLGAAYIDVEHVYDPEYAENIGVDNDDLLFSQPMSAEEALGIMETCAKSGGFGVVVLDSIAFLSPKSEMEGEMYDHNIGTQAKLLKRAMRKIVPFARETNTLIVFTNHITYKIGVMHGSPETEPGGTAVPYAASMRIDMRRREQEKDGGVAIGNNHHVKFVKNKCAPPYRECDVKIIYGEGFSKEESLIEMALDAGIMRRAGAWYKYGDDNIGQGLDKTIVFLKENPDFAKMLKDTIDSI